MDQAIQTEQDEELIPYHVPTSFKTGDRVKVVRRVDKAHAWYAEPWNGGRTDMIGRTFRINGTDTLYGFYIPNEAGGGAWFPSTALEIAVQEPIQVPAAVPVTSPSLLLAKAKAERQLEIAEEFKRQGLQADGTPPPAAAAQAKKPRTTKPGPWDIAPCTHLKWHLMGFYKEKLKLSVTKVTSSTGMAAVIADGAEAELTFCCSKCTKTIVMTAPIKVTK